MKAAPLAASLFVMGLGALVLTGWALDIDAIKSVAPHLVAMKPNTAIGLLLSGLALALVSRGAPGKQLRFWVGLLAAIVIALGLLTLPEYIFGWNPGIDQWLFKEAPDTAWTSQPGRMAPVSAFCFVLVGVGLLAAARPAPGRYRLPILAGLGAALAVIGAIALAGCLAEGVFHAPSWNDSGLATHTALAFLLLGAVLVMLAISQGGLTWSLHPVVTTGFAFSIAVMLLTAIVSYRYTNQLLETATWLSHRQEVFKEIGNAMAGMANIESAERGYIVLGDEKLIEGLDQTKATVRATLDNLRKLTAGNPAQQRRLDQLDVLVPQGLDFAAQTIASRRRQGFPASQQMIATRKGIHLTEAINGLLKEMRDAEYALLDGDQKRARTAITRTFLVLPLGVFLSLTISSLGLFFLNAGVGERVRIEGAWRDSEERFQTVIENLTEGLVISRLDGQLLHWNPAALAIHGFASGEDGRRQLSEIGAIFELATLDGSVVPVEDWPMSRVIRGERLRDLSMRVRRRDRPWERVFSYGGSIVREPGGKQLAFLTMFDITERTRSEEALRASEKQLGSFVEQAPVALAMLDRNMVYLAVSRRWVTDYGRGHTGLVGLCHYDLVPDLPDRWKEIHRQALNGIPHRCDAELWEQAGGGKDWLRWAVQPWRDAQGEVAGIMILTEDITDLKQAEQIRLENLRLEEENRRVAEASRLKSEFLANMSHELRTPLNGIIGFTELMVDERPGPLNRKQKEYLGDVLNSARHLLQLINDVLDLAKVEAGKFDFQPGTFPPAQAIEEVCAVVRGLAGRKQIELRSEFEPGLGGVTLDEHRFKQICYNLLSNAVKFTDPGGYVEIAVFGVDAGNFEVRVTDSGIGIREEDMPRLFREFEQLETGAARRFEGTGLGLALTKKLVQLQGGSISARSVYGKGSTFTVVLPRVAESVQVSRLNPG